jgi:Na+-translocating ferredoxin:NAD+ oxidoreductase RNF subunit RnfB
VNSTERFYHSVTLDKGLCVGCTNCIKRCPTQAIRVRDGKAQIITERCIDCGSCGAPTCRALAEDIVKGLARETDCIFLMRREIQQISSKLEKLKGFIPDYSDTLDSEQGKQV